MRERCGFCANVEAMGDIKRSAAAARAPPSSWLGDHAAELILLLVMGLFMGAIGPYGTAVLPPRQSYVYWIACIVGGGLIGVVIDETVGRRAWGSWRRLALTSLAMTPVVTLLVILIGHVVAGHSLHIPRYPALTWQVFIVCVPVMALRALVWRRQRTVVETRIVVSTPLPEAEAAFRRRLSARRRTARLIAIEADDHYLRVHTDAGSELVTASFASALEELSGAHGFRTHRSWWVAADAIEAVRWRRGAGEARLAGDLIAPVSRTPCGPAVKAAVAGSNQATISLRGRRRGRPAGRNFPALTAALRIGPVVSSVRTVSATFLADSRIDAFAVLGVGRLDRRRQAPDQ